MEDLEEAQRDGHADADQDAEQHRSQCGGDGEEQFGGAESGESHQLVPRHERAGRVEDHGGERCLGKVLDQRPGDEQDEDHERCGDQRVELGAGPGGDGQRRA